MYNDVLFSFVICASVPGNEVPFQWLACIFCWTNLIPIELFLEGYSFQQKHVFLCTQSAGHLLEMPRHSDRFSFASVNAARQSLPRGEGVLYETITKRLWKIPKRPYHNLFYNFKFLQQGAFTRCKCCFGMSGLRPALPPTAVPRGDCRAGAARRLTGAWQLRQQITNRLVTPPWTFMRVVRGKKS